MEKLVNELRLVQHAKSAFIVMSVVLCIILLNGCSSKEDTDPEPEDNEVVYAGQKVGINRASQSHKVYDIGDVIFVYFYLDNGHILSLGILLPSGKTKLVAGDYEDEDILYAEVWDGNDNELPTLYEATSANAGVALSGSKYTVDVDSKLSGKKTLKANYSGEIPWSEAKAFSSTGSLDKLQLKVLDKETLINQLKTNMRIK